MIDLGLLLLCKKAIAAKPRKKVTPQIMLAVAMQESSGMPYFVDTKPGSLYAMNMHVAVRGTGIERAELVNIVTIKKDVGDFKVPAVLVGKLAKFRFESGYWLRYKDLAPRDRFIYSCSWGIFQFMGPNIVKTHRPEDIEFIQRFAADLPMQCLYAAGMIDDLLAANGGSVDAMYRAYNSGNAHSQNPAVIARARAVTKSAAELAHYLTDKRL